MWSKRGIYWFHVYKQRKPGSKQAEAAYRQAIEAIAKALYIDDFTFCGALHASNLALSLTDSGKLEDAENFVKQALKINPWSEEAYRTLYAITLKKREYKKALNCLKKLSKIKPKDGEIHLDRAALHYFLNQTEKAKEEYNKGIKLGAKPRQKLEQLILSH